MVPAAGKENVFGVITRTPRKRGILILQYHRGEYANKKRLGEIKTTMFRKSILCM